MDERSQTTKREEFSFPPPTPESRAAIGCYGSGVGVYDTCWCGYSVVLGFGQCPECQGKQLAFIASGKPA